MRRPAAALRFPAGPARPPAGRRAFTLLEMLMVLAIGGLIATVLFIGSESLLRAAQRDDLENSALTALAAARREAVTTNQTLRLRGAADGRRLEWGGHGADLKGEGAARLLGMTSSSVLIGGRLVENTIASVRFYPDGTCDPFRLELVHDNRSLILNIDPWTCTALTSAASRP
ncbi:MAG: prepilin-type N-terminal cleavage/methylation domain-containing protein [Opitutae bacterium]|nr:prepilin-type N-terminal cleavage/methylation domain-containing protein [Opitutae bacterium]